MNVIIKHKRNTTLFCQSLWSCSPLNSVGLLFLFCNYL